MSIQWDKRNQRWRFAFDAVVEGERHRSTKLLPRAWDKAKAAEYDHEETGRLYAVIKNVAEADPLIETAVKFYLTDKRSLKSIISAAEHLNAILPHFEGKRMSALKDVASAIEQDRARRNRKTGGVIEGGKPLSDATVKQRIALLKAACRWAWKKHGLTKQDPTGQMQLPSVKNDRHVYRTRADMLRACRACTNHMAQIAIRVAFYTGMRLGELMRAYPEGGTLVLEDTKNGDRRAIPVHPKIKHLMPFMPLPGPKRTIQKAWERARNKVGMRGVHFHDLRHSSASEMVNAKVDLFIVGRVLGHRDARSTQRYAHLTVDALAGAVGKIGQRKG